MLERASPIHYKKDVWIIHRILYNKIQDEYYLDIRAFQKIYYNEGGEKKSYIKQTKLGLNCEIGRWVEVVDTAIKLIQKYKKRK